MTPKRILVLNSYSLTSRPVENQIRFRAFLEGLEQGGYRWGENLEVDIVDSNSLGELETQTRKAIRRPLNLIHAVGTPNAIVAINCGGGTPVVYYGAHPEGAGELECRAPGVAGVVLTLPFTQDYKQFRFVRKLFPNVTTVWVPFYEKTVFCQPDMQAKHHSHRTGLSNSPWVSGDSSLVGYRGLAGLCYVTGLEYRELVYQDRNDLLRGLKLLDQDGALLMPYNDSVYCAGAPTALVDFSATSDVPLFWNNNTEATRIGAVAAISGCFREAGVETGKMAAAILDGASPQSFQLLKSTKTYASLNLARAHALGLDPSPEVIAQFDEVILADALTEWAPEWSNR
jgi:ABC-type uncharacterized transport system substrate-binding protein